MLITSTRPAERADAPAREESEAPDQNVVRRVGPGVDPRRVGHGRRVVDTRAEAGWTGTSGESGTAVVIPFTRPEPEVEPVPAQRERGAGVIAPVRPAERRPRRRPAAPGHPSRRLRADAVRSRRSGCASSAPPSLHGSRLTRRGRVVVGALWVVLVVVAAVPFLRYEGGSQSDVETVPVEVEVGDTLWRLAREADPDGDPRALVDAIMDLNDLASGADIRPGDTLVVPAGDQ